MKKLSHVLVLFLLSSPLWAQSQLDKEYERLAQIKEIILSFNMSAMPEKTMRRQVLKEGAEKSLSNVIITTGFSIAGYKAFHQEDKSRLALALTGGMAFLTSSLKELKGSLGLIKSLPKQDDLNKFIGVFETEAATASVNPKRVDDTIFAWVAEKQFDFSYSAEQIEEVQFVFEECGIKSEVQSVLTSLQMRSLLACFTLALPEIHQLYRANIQEQQKQIGNEEVLFETSNAFRALAFEWSLEDLSEMAGVFSNQNNLDILKRLLILYDESKQLEGK